jgi:hypothetical protein
MPSIENDADASPEAMSAETGPVVAETEPPHPLVAKVDEWFAEVMADLPASLPTQIHLHFLTAVADLKQRLTA